MARTNPSTTFVSDASLAGFVPGDHVDEPGEYDLEVRNPDGQIAMRSDGFAFEDIGGSADDSGCGCVAVESRGEGAGFGLIALAALALRRRRR